MLKKNADEVNVLLTEYETLRSEIVQKLATNETYAGVAVAILGTLIALVFQFEKKELLLFLPIVCVFLYSQNVRREWAISYVASFLSVLEKRINGLVNSEALTWEHRDTIGIFSQRSRYSLKSKKADWVPDWIYESLYSLLFFLVFLALVILGSFQLYGALSNFDYWARVSLVFTYSFFHVALTLLIFWVHRTLGPRVLSDLREQWEADYVLHTSE